MIQVSTEVANALNQTSRQFDAKIYVNGSAVGCEIMSLKLHKGACGKFTVGSIFIPYVELTINGTTTLTTNTEFELKIAVKVNGSFGTYYRVGYFTPTSIENQRTQTEIYAQGRIANTNQKLFTSEPSARSLQNILTAIRNKGYTVDLKDLTIPNASIDQLLPMIDFSVRDGIELLVACAGGYATEDANGHIVLGRFKSYTPTALDGDKLSNYPTVQGTYNLTGITIVVSESLKYEIPSEQATKNFEIKNPYFNSSMVSTFTSNTIGYTFPVMELPISLGDFRYEPMDYLSFEGSNIPCFTLDFEFDGGLKTTVKAEGDLPEVTNTKTAGPISAQLQEAYDKAIGAMDLANSVDERVDEIEEDGVTTVITKVQWAKGTSTAPVGEWTDDIPSLTTDYSYLWTRVATVSRDPQTGEETITDWTTPQKSTLLNGVYAFVNHASNGDATVIDGGSIITGTLSANQIVVGSATMLDVELGSMNYNIDEAQDTADSAQSTANTAQSTANTANTTAQTALTTAQGAGATATNYITTIGGRTGICVHALNDTSNYCNINSSGLGVYVGGSLTSSFGASLIELGKNSSSAKISMCGGYGIIGYDSGNGAYLQSASSIATLKTANSCYMRVDSSRISFFTSSCYVEFNSYDGILVDKVSSNGRVTGSGIYTNQDLTNVSGKPNVRWASNTYYFGMATDTSSSRRWKHFIKPVENEELDPTKLYDLPVVQFRFNEDHIAEDSHYKGKDIIGLIAEDVEDVYPIAVWYDEFGKPESWNEQPIIAGMLKLLQDQHNEIEELKARLI